MTLMTTTGQTLAGERYTRRLRTVRDMESSVALFSLLLSVAYTVICATRARGLEREVEELRLLQPIHAALLSEGSVEMDPSADGGFAALYRDEQWWATVWYAVWLALPLPVHALLLCVRRREHAAKVCVVRVFKRRSSLLSSRRSLRLFSRGAAPRELG